MKKYTYNQIMQVMAQKGYEFYRTGLYNLNIIGVRSNESQSDKFDDSLYVIYRDDSGWVLHCFNCTTDPGKHWLLSPFNKAGTLIMKPGQWKGVYKIGLHNRTNPSKQYKALEQVGEIEYVRDNNRDGKLDFDLFKNSKNIIKGIFKSNIHKASALHVLTSVGKYSAGCQVIQKAEDFELFMRLAEAQIENKHRNSFTYTLLTEDDFNNL